jgi:PAS domain S-box-containing protein
MPVKLSSKNRWLLRYAAALAAVGAGLLVRLGLTALVGEGLPTYITFYPVIMAVALLGGFGPGLVATAATALTVDYWVLPPHGQFGIAHLVDAVGLAFFSGMGVFMSAVAELYHRARQKAATYAEQLPPWIRQEEPPRPWAQRLLLNGGMVLSLAILAAAGWQAHRHMAAMVEADRWVTHTYAVNEEIEHFLMALQDMEAAVHGYLVTGQAEDLRPYTDTVPEPAKRLAALEAQTRDNPAQTQRLAGLEALLGANLAVWKETVELRRTRGFEAAQALMANGKARALSEQVRRRMDEAQEEEDRLLLQRIHAKDTSLGSARQALLSGGVLGFLLLAAGFVFLRQENAGRRQAQTELRRHRDLLQDIVTARTAELDQQREWLHVTLSSIGDAVLATDTAGHVTFLNPVAETLTGWGAKEAQGQPARNVFQVINENTRAPVEDIVARVLQEGRAVTLANHTTLVTRDGREVPIEDSAAPIRDSAGTVSGVVLVFHDVSEKRRAQTAMQESERQFRTLADSIPNLAWRANGDGYITWYNRRWYEYTGTTPQQMEGWGWQSVHDPQTLPAVLERWKASIATGQPFDMTFPLRGADGSFRPFLTRVLPLKDAQDRVQQWFGTNTDVSEKERAEEAMRDLNAQLQRRVAELQAANEEIQASRRAALSLTEDALEARTQAERVNADLQKAVESLGASRRAAMNLMEDAVRARNQAEQSGAESRSAAEQRRLALEAADLGAWDYHFQTGEVFWDERCREMWGLPQTETINYDGAIGGIHPEDRAGVDEAVKQALAGKDGGAYHREFRVVWPDGSVHWISSHGHVYFQGEGEQRRAVRFIGANQEITQRKQREEQLQQLNRTLKALKNSSQAMMRATSEAEYLAEVCKIVVQDCGHAMVWVGFAEDDPHKTVRPIASAGFEEGYVETLRITWADTERGRGPTGTAIRTGKPSGCANILTDPRLAPWREEARKRGYASSLVVPLLESRDAVARRPYPRALGALTIYSRQPDSFSPDEVTLLTQLADDVSYCIRALRLRAAKEAADRELRQINEELEQRVIARTAELHAAFRYSRSLLEASLDPLVTISPEGKITDVNEATELVTGVGRDRLIGSDFSHYFTEPAQAEAGYQQVLAEGQVRDYPLTIRHSSGPTTDVLYNATVYRNEAGQVQGVFAAARDITERKQAERRRDLTSALLGLFARKTSARDYLSSVVETIQHWTGCQALGIRIADEQGEIPYAAWAGFEPRFIELENRLSLQRDNCCCIRAISQAFEPPDRDLVTPGGSYRADDAIAFVNKLAPEKRTRYRGNCMNFGFASLAIIPIRYREEVVGAVHLADRRSGQFPLATVEFLETLTPLIGEAVHRFETEAELARHRDQLEVLVQQRTRELTDANARLQQTAEDLKRSNRDLEQFAYVASHDLQEPLRAVGGYVRLLQHRFADKLDAKAQDYITGAFDGAMRMERLITDLLAFSRIGGRGGNFVPAPLEGLLGQALRNLHVGIEAAHATVTHDPLPALSVDATQIMQLFQNLIGNALKFHGEQPPKIHVGAQSQDGRWVFSVRDNGIGIEPQYFGKIFHIFQRLHTRKEYPGTGIGLAICKRIVERHGGQIWLESQPGQGSTFYFSIPEAAAR